MVKNGTRLPRLSSPAGIAKRAEIRAATQPVDNGKYHYIKPGSMNPRKVTR